MAKSTKEPIWTRLGIALWSFREAMKGQGPLALPPGGRSSVESNLSGRLSGYLNGLGTVSPIIDFDVLRCLNYLAIYNPDFSQFVENIVNLGNPGHSLTVDATSDSVAESALARLNEAASRIYTNGAGVDGLINACLRQAAVFGAISSEDVVNLGARRVEQVVIVPVQEIRFRYQDGQYVPFQYPNTMAGLTRGTLGLIELNPNTYHYYALQTVENSPYGQPPATSVVELLTGPQKDVIDNIKFIVAKLGILGMVSVSVAPPRQKPGSETDAEYQARAGNYLRLVRDSLEGNFNKGLVVTYRDQKVEHANVAAGAASGLEIVKWLEQLIMSGFGMPPAFFGRTDSTTETYADVVYQQLLDKVGNFQRLVKRRQEATYRLDLRLAGIEVDAISLQFDKPHSRSANTDALAEQYTVNTVIRKAKAGIISPDQAAQELGYDSAFDPELMTAPDVGAGGQGQGQDLGQSFRALLGAKSRGGAVVRFHFDKRSQRYRYLPTPAIDVSSSGVEPAAVGSNVVELKKKRLVSTR